MNSKRVLVEAGAGCGKTTSIVNRFLAACTSVREGGEGLQPEDIVLLTFTDAAANEMRERLAAKAQHLDLSRAQISTFHAHCFKLVKNFLPPHEKLLSEDQAYFLLKDILLEKIAKHSERDKVLELLSLRELFDLVLAGYFSDLKHDLDLLRNTWKEFRDKNLQLLKNLELEELAPNDWPCVLRDRLQTNSLSGRIQFSTKKALKDITDKHPELKFAAGLVRGLEEAKLFTPLMQLFDVEEKALNFLFEIIQSLQTELPFYLTFDRLERLCLELLEKSTLQVSAPKLLIVDEFQDTNLRQWKIIEKISSPETSWYLVGDPKQSIYAFRKADLKIYSELKKSLSLLELETNHRSTPELLGLFNFLQQKIFTTEHDPSFQLLKAALPGVPGLKACRVHERLAHEAQDVLRTIQKRESELPASHHGVLFREWKKLYEFANYLHGQNIPYEVLGSEDLLDHSLSSIFLNFLGSLEKPDFLSATLSQLFSPALSSAAIQDLAKDSDVWNIFYFFVQGIQVSRWPRGNEWAAAMEKILFSFDEANELSLAKVEEILQKRYYSPVALSRLEHTQQSLHITLMTVHGSKGLEFDCLYLPDPRETVRRRREAAEGEIPFQFSIAPQLKSRSLYFELKNMRRQLDRELEEKRLFYVAFTRAKKSIDFFIVPGKNHTKRDSVGWHELWDSSSNDPFKWSPVIRELRNQADVEWIEEQTSPQKETVKWEKLLPRKATNKDAKFVSTNVTTYLEGMSVATTPLQPLQASLDSRQQDWGTSLHKALELWDGNETQLVDVLDFLAPLHAPTVKIALQKLRQLKELQFYWKEFEKNPLERKLYREASLIVASDAYELTGQADALLFSDKQLTILDWKSSSGTFNPERIEKIRAQLHLYAQSFTHFHPKIRLFSVGIETQNNHTPRVLVDE